MNNALPMHLINFAISTAPILVVLLLGGIAAIINWKRAPTPSLLVLLAMLDFGAYRVLNGIFQAFIVPALLEQGRRNVDISWLFMINGIVGTVSSVLGFVLLLCAVYIGRPQTPHIDPYGYPGK